MSPAASSGTTQQVDVARVHEAFDGKGIFGGDVGHTTLDDILVLFSLDGYRL